MSVAQPSTMRVRRAFDLHARYPISCQTPGCVIRRHERDGVDKVQAVVVGGQWAHMIDS